MSCLEHLIKLIQCVSVSLDILKINEISGKNLKGFFFPPVTYLVCTQMRVVRDLTENPSSTIYLTTSNESQIFITGNLN